MTLPVKEFEVITNQPSARSSAISPDDTHTTLTENEEIDSKSRFTITPIRNDQPIGPLNLPENDKLPDNNTMDVPNGTANPPNTAIIEKSNQPISNKNSHKESRPSGHPGAETSVGLSLCLLQLCNFCTGCCDEYYNWCCCCCHDSDLCVSCCTGCMECCTACDCSCCN